MLVVQPPTTGDKLCALARDAPPESHQKNNEQTRQNVYTARASSKTRRFGFFQPVDDFWPRECATWPFQSFATGHDWRQHIAIAVDAFIALRTRVDSAVVSLHVISTKSKPRTLFLSPADLPDKFCCFSLPFLRSNLGSRKPSTSKPLPLAAE